MLSRHQKQPPPRVATSRSPAIDISLLSLSIQRYLEWRVASGSVASPDHERDHATGPEDDATATRAALAGGASAARRGRAALCAAAVVGHGSAVDGARQRR